jgi:flagellar biosynthesis/type III secretory pathway protein FliH
MKENEAQVAYDMGLRDGQKQERDRAYAEGYKDGQRDEREAMKVWLETHAEELVRDAYTRIASEGGRP